MPSVRRSRRGRRVRLACAAASFVGGGEIVFVVIYFSVVVLDRAAMRAEAAAHGLVREVSAEPLAADDATIQVNLFFGVAAGSAVSFVGQGHGRNFSRRSALSIILRPAARMAV